MNGQLAMLDANLFVFRYKDFSQLCHMLRGELSLTLEETLGANKENKSVSNACQIKLDQFPTLPPKVCARCCYSTTITVAIVVTS